MSDQAILNRATLILRKVGPDNRADEALRTELGFHKNWSAVEVRGIVRAVNAYFRWYLWLPHKAPFQTKVEEALRLQDRFDKSEANIKVEALRARAVPEWLSSELEMSSAFLRQLQRDPVLWIRIRKGQEVAVLEDLASCVKEEVSPLGDGRVFSAIRYTGTRDLFRTVSFKEGRFEIQDLSSQIVSFVCDPNPGETWWDTCAGEGGKTIHLADLMENKGLIWASDRSKRRMATLKKRAARAGVFNFRQEIWEGDDKLPTKTQFDGVLVDAPCSGVGTWQRHPHSRWTTELKDVTELAEVQKGLLSHASTVVKPGGRLIYSVCTITKTEGAGVVKSFGETHPDFELKNTYTLMPGDINSNGMFIAEWVRKA